MVFALSHKACLSVLVGGHGLKRLSCSAHKEARQSVQSFKRFAQRASQPVDDEDTRQNRQENR